MGYDRFVKAVKDQIGKRGIKQNFVAERIGLSPQAFSRKLNGGTKFTINEISKLMKLLDIPPEILLD